MAYTVQVNPFTGSSVPAQALPDISEIGSSYNPPRPFSPPTGPTLPGGFPNPYAGYNPALDPGAFAVPKWISSGSITSNPTIPWNFQGAPFDETGIQYGLLPPPRSLISPWDTAPAQRYNTYTNVYGQQFTTPQQINLSRFSSSPSGALPLYIDQDIANILSTALGY